MTRLFNAKKNVLDWAAANLDSRFVTIDAGALAALQAPKGLSAMQANLANKAVGSSLKNAVQFLIALNSLNYKFWDITEAGFTRYSYEGAVGAMGMRKAFDANWGAEHDATPQTLRRQFAEKSIVELFGSIPDADTRIEILGEILQGSILEQLAAELTAVIEETGRLTVDDAALIASVFPLAYQDPTLKKAQLAIAEIAGHCAEVGIIAVPTLTVFADYQVPRVLRALKVLKYSTELSTLVDSQALLEAGGPEESAIRAATLLAGEVIATRFEVDPSVVDNYLWLQRAQAGTAPFHLTRTTQY
jgi:Potential Queuosine, Q, salvage protein family